MILRDRDASAAWPPGKPSRQTDGTLAERTYHCQNWRADVVALMTDAGRLVNQVRYDPYGVPFGIPKTDMDGDGDADTDDYTLYYSYYTGSTMPFADWNWDGTKNSTDLIAYGNDRTADSTLGRGDLSYGYSRASGAGRRGYAGYEVDPVLTGSEGWESVYHVRNRVLFSCSGSWTSRDPLGVIDGIGLYMYTADMPLIATDPLGLALEICSDFRPRRVVREGDVDEFWVEDPDEGTSLRYRGDVLDDAISTIFLTGSGDNYFNLLEFTYRLEDHWRQSHNHLRVRTKWTSRLRANWGATIPLIGRLSGKIDNDDPTGEIGFYFDVRCSNNRTPYIEGWTPNPGRDDDGISLMFVHGDKSLSYRDEGKQGIIDLAAVNYSNGTRLTRQKVLWYQSPVADYSFEVFVGVKAWGGAGIRLAGHAGSGKIYYWWCECYTPPRDGGPLP